MTARSLVSPSLSFGGSRLKRRRACAKERIAPETGARRKATRKS